MTVNHPKIIGVNLFKIIETLYHNKEVLQKNSMYLKELCQTLHRESKDVKVDVMYLSSLDYVVTDFIEDTVNQRVAYLTPKAMMVMDRAIPPKNYDEFIKMQTNSEKYFEESKENLDKKPIDTIKKGFKITKSIAVAILTVGGAIIVIATLLS